MQISWMNAAALVGLGLIALPIAIHLLVRQQTRTLLYPSLRFLRETALAACRRRRIEDAILLVCRVAIVALAALAMAGPIVQTPSRIASYAGRIARAQVVADASAVKQDAVAAAGAFRFASFSRVEVADAIRDALRWLGEQPPAAREIVFSGPLARGSIDAADLLVIPKDVGVRFVPAEHRAPPDGTVRTMILRNGDLVLVERHVRLDADSTRVDAGAERRVPADRIRVIAAPREQPLADAALRTVLEEGVLWTTVDRRVEIVWEGADPPTPEAIRQRLEASAPLGLEEPIAIAAEQLEAWSRPPGPPSATAPPADEGDRRWVWALVLALLAVEQRLRRTVPDASISEEARVA